MTKPLIEVYAVPTWPQQSVVVSVRYSKYAFKMWPLYTLGMDGIE